MHVIQSDNIFFFDVDESLVFWDTTSHPEDKQHIVQVPDPYMRDKGCLVDMVPHFRNIDLLKRNKGQGRTVIVWSAGGSLWAESVVKTLGLEEYVDYVMSKPIAYLDDKPMEEWGITRVYLSKHLPKHPI